MKRYYIAPVIGSGIMQDPYRLKVKDAGATAFACLIPTGQDGKPLFDWGLACVNMKDHSAILKHSDIEPLPDLDQHAELATISKSASESLESRIAKFGIKFDHNGPQVRMRDLVNAIGKHLDAQFDAEFFHVDE